MGWLEFSSNVVSALAWPVVVLVGLLLFRSQVRDLLSGLKDRFNRLSEISGPGGFSAKFAADAREAGAVLSDVSSAEKAEVDPEQAKPSPDADAGAELPSGSGVGATPDPTDMSSTPRPDPTDDARVHTPEQEPDSGPRPPDPRVYSRRRVRDARERWLRERVDRADFDRMRKVASDSPRGAVLEAFVSLELTLDTVLNVAWRVGAVTPPAEVNPRSMSASRMLQALTQNTNSREPALPEGYDLAVRNLIRLRNEAAHNRDYQLSPEAARAYVDAVETAVALLNSHAEALLKRYSRPGGSSAG